MMTRLRIRFDPSLNVCLSTRFDNCIPLDCLIRHTCKFNYNLGGCSQWNVLWGINILINLFTSVLCHFRRGRDYYATSIRHLCALTNGIVFLNTNTKYHIHVVYLKELSQHHIWLLYTIGVSLRHTLIFNVIFGWLLTVECLVRH